MKILGYILIFSFIVQNNSYCQIFSKRSSPIVISILQPELVIGYNKYSNDQLDMKFDWEFSLDQINLKLIEIQKSYWPGLSIDWAGITSPINGSTAKFKDFNLNIFYNLTLFEENRIRMTEGYYIGRRFIINRMYWVEGLQKFSINPIFSYSIKSDPIYYQLGLFFDFSTYYRIAGTSFRFGIKVDFGKKTGNEKVYDLNTDKYKLVPFTSSWKDIVIFAGFKFGFLNFGIY
jgi:hypothetical protein